MLRRPYKLGSGLRLCRACELVSGQQWAQPAKRPFVALHVGRHSVSPITTRAITTSAPCRKAKRSQNSQSPETSPSRFSRTGGSATYQPPSADSAAVLAAVDRVLKAFLAPSGIQSEELTLWALRALAQTDVRSTPDAGEHRSEDAAAETRRPASQLLGLGGVAPTTGDVARPQRSHSQRSQDVIDRVSDAAYTIVTQPTVVITRRILEEYVQLQARLGRPQTLPQILALYANKPTPKLESGSIRYVERNPSKADSAVDPAVADMALDAAIEAKDLEAAIGILENTYSSKAFLRSKLIRKALLPGCAVAATPAALYYAATELAQLQHALEPKIATGMAFAGALCYVGFTASIGLVAHFTANDQMKRVTWASGTPLRHRWLYEEERAALDKIACAFGFSEEHRYGEEEGEEFMWLREYILSRSMILDAVDLMPGMN
ncbi:hypothetical protein C8A03DRAFT_11446 [Achaetomium macrosporum]|uniref:Uncharacterized protein n=1 Tax=Achaetomium macrosporum TaxID=79813 RepID=A0AAN7HH11_9PEZI|nr:hypothetical protein C8A03DRAFT_11446 [Achaetomium macrosporum]